MTSAVAAAVINSRDVEANELQHVMRTFDVRLAACTPGDAAQKFKPSSLVPGDATTIKVRVLQLWVDEWLLACVNTHRAVIAG